MLVFFILLLVFSSTRADFTYEPCLVDEPHDVIVHDLHLKPDPLTKNLPVTVHVNATVLADVTADAYIVGEARYMFIRFPIKETRVDEYVDVPVRRGQYSDARVFSSDQLKDLPPGEYLVHLEGHCPRGLLFCVDMHIDLSERGQRSEF